VASHRADMDIPSPFSGSADEETFAPEDEFVPAHLPEPGPFLTDHDVLTGDDHVGFHATTRELFEKRGVYDITFGYNLARLNRDTRHPDAGYRYAEDTEESSVLRAVFTPTTEFCPQTETLATGSFRAWNGLSESHDYELVRVRVDPMHNDAEAVNVALSELEREYRETGSVPDPDAPTGQTPDEDVPSSPF